MKMLINHLTVMTLIITALMIVFKITSHNATFSQQKYSTFECGFDVLSSLRLPFSINFFVVSIIFLIFDVELILLIPFIFIMKMNQMKITYIILISFFFILMLSFIYEWWMGLLNWMT